MIEPIENTERIVTGKRVTLGGVPVALELNRGVLEIHVGNIDLTAEDAVNYVNMHTPGKVRISIASEHGIAGAGTAFNLYAQPDQVEGVSRRRKDREHHRPQAAPLPGRRGALDYWDEDFGNREIVTAAPETAEGEDLLRQVMPRWPGGQEEA